MDLVKGDLNTNEYIQFFSQEITENFWPFWKKAFDHKHGGVFTCFTNDGSKLISHDKYTWSQGRFLWLCSELYQLTQEGLLPLNSVLLKEMADKTYAFLRRNTLTETNHILYAVSSDGKRIDGMKDISIYADCFFVLGINKYAEVFKNEEAFHLALSVYRTINNRVEMEAVKTEPYPIPKGFLSHSLNMILLNVAQEIEETANVFSYPIRDLDVRNSKDISKFIIKEFISKDNRCIELKRENRESDESLLERHLNPGHTLEAIWFHIHILNNGDKNEQQDVIKKLSRVALKALESGWDEEYGGLLRFADKDGGKPVGKVDDNDPYCVLIRETWDTKLWWPHSEALYTLPLLYKHTKNEVFKNWFQKLFAYSFRTFPNPNKEIGEWIQIRDRKGMPLNKVVALPVKDPFHVLRNFILIIKLFK
jgi:N-acylglucosamine 2-epimerase